MSVQASHLVIGRVIGKAANPNTFNVKVVRLSFNQRLNMYYNKEKTYEVYDDSNRCIDGDIVVIQEMPKRMTPTLRYKVAEFVYKTGNMIDPLCNRPIFGPEFTDETDLAARERQLKISDQVISAGLKTISKDESKGKPTWQYYNGE